MKEDYREHRTSLTPQEKLRVAVAVIIDGFDQHKVAALMGVNPGRVNEAVQDIRKAIGIDNGGEKLPPPPRDAADAARRENGQ